MILSPIGSDMVECKDNSPKFLADSYLQVLKTLLKDEVIGRARISIEVCDYI